jgi:large-conductance mechanosensitive channel
LAKYQKQSDPSMAMDTGAFFENVVVTFIIVVTFLFLTLAFLYMIYGKEEKQTTASTAPKTKTSA